MGLLKPEGEFEVFLKQMNVSLDRMNKINWLALMQWQKAEAEKTPTTIKPGTYGFNPTNSATQLSQWRQLVPRRNRRNRVVFTALNQTFFLAVGDTQVDINQLITEQQIGFNGTLAVFEYTFTAGSRLDISTTEAIWGASLIGSGSLYEQQATISWYEEIFSDIMAIPTVSIPNPDANTPGKVQRLTAGLMHVDGDQRATYSKDGVR